MVFDHYYDWALIDCEIAFGEPVFVQVEAVLFESQKPQRGWNLAMMMTGLGITDIIPALPDSGALGTILDQVKLDDLVFIRVPGLQFYSPKKAGRPAEKYPSPGGKQYYPGV